MLSAATFTSTATWSLKGPTGVEYGISLTAERLKKFLDIHKYFLSQNLEPSFRPEVLLYQGSDYTPVQFVTTEEGKILKEALLRSSELVHEGELID